MRVVVEVKGTGISEKHEEEGQQNEITHQKREKK